MNILYRIRLCLMSISIPLGKLISKVHRPPSKITSELFERAENIIEDGDLVLSHDEYSLSNLVIPGYWKHVGIYYEGYIYEAATSGVRCIRFDEWMYKKDYVAIVRAKSEFTPEEYTKGFTFLLSCVSDKDSYDFTMSMSDLSRKTEVDMGSIKSWYCSKYAYAFFKSMDSKFTDKFTLRETLGEPTVVPQDYWDAVSKFDRIYTSGT